MSGCSCWLLLKILQEEEMALFCQIQLFNVCLFTLLKDQIGDRK